MPVCLIPLHMCRSVLQGCVVSVEDQRCHEVEFDDSSVCDSVPESDMVCVCVVCVCCYFD